MSANFDNPYESPRPETNVSEPAEEPSPDESWFVYRLAAACYPLPFLLALAAWMSFPYFFFKLPLSIVPYLASGVAIGMAVVLTRTLTDRLVWGWLLRPVLTILYILAILAAWPLAIRIYLLLGFREPFP